MSTDTIYALASAPGRAGVAVLRVSGAAAFESFAQLCPNKTVVSHRAILCRLKDPDTSALLDEALVLPFKSPASYTGEDVIEYHLHGGTAVIESVMDALSKFENHRLALPGEFTRRAFENGKMDLTAAEAVADLIDAETQAQKIQAQNQMGGALSSLYEGWCEALTRVLAYCEADIDFPDEDLPDGIVPEVLPKIQTLSDEIIEHLNDNHRGERLRDGVRVAIIGAPNAGKSSLVNALAKRDVAIVSEQAGTTRDVIEVHLNLGGYPVIVADTAGLRPEQIGNEGHDAIEQEGIRRALQKAEEADIRVLLFDGSALPNIDDNTLKLKNNSSIVVFNKADVSHETIPEIEGIETLSISASQGTGLDDFISLLQVRIQNMLGRSETPSLTRQRHRTALEQAQKSLSRALAGSEAELVAEDLRLAIRHIGQITGRVDVEDLLDVIFRDFCIGK